MTEAVYGRLVSTWQVGQAALSTLKEWLPSYLAVLERQNGLTAKSLGRPEPVAYFQAQSLDAAGPGATVPADPPLVLVTVQPLEEPERQADGYTQNYDLTVACIVYSEESEEQALRNASLYGAASMLLVQLGALGGLAERTIMRRSPRTEYVAPETSERRMIRSVAEYEVWVPEVVLQSGPAGPTLGESPEIDSSEAVPKTPPEVKTTDVEVKGKEL